MLHAILQRCCAIRYCSVLRNPMSVRTMSAVRILSSHGARFADGAAFGTAGSYQWVEGELEGTLIPDAPGNRDIVNLHRAPRDGDGRVIWRVPFAMLRPSNGSDTLLLEVPNRGRKLAFPYFNDAPEQSPSAVNRPRTAADAGNGYLLRASYALLWLGWEVQAPAACDGMAAQLPWVDTDHADGFEYVWDEFVPGGRSVGTDKFVLAYDVADAQRDRIELWCARGRAQQFTRLPNDTWHLKDRRIVLSNVGAWEAGSCYRVRYPARRTPVCGIGYALVRDVVAALHHDADVLVALHGGKAYRHTLALGISQSGRWLTDFLRGGFNRDACGRRVFDGVFSYTAGAGGIDLNRPFSQPARTRTSYEDNLYPEQRFPFSAAAAEDPRSGNADALLRADPEPPKAMFVNTGSEYWQKGASLLHTSPDGLHDLALPDWARCYLAAGTQHVRRGTTSGDPGVTAWPTNPHDPSPLLRALLAALHAWVAESTPPPASCVPRIADGTLVDASALQWSEKLKHEIAVGAPPKATALVSADVDWTRWDDGDSRYHVLVPQVDADGNECGGVRLPDIDVPLATYTGWNWFAAPLPSDQLGDRHGLYTPFSAQRIAAHFADPQVYLAQTRRAVMALQARGLLLAEDAHGYLCRAERLAANWPPYEERSANGGRGIRSAHCIAAQSPRE
jgi:hypothetical protein